MTKHKHSIRHASTSPRGPKRKVKSVKRPLGEGLKAWNFAKAYISRENKKMGKKFNRVELDTMVKLFLLEHYGKTEVSYNDLDLFLREDIPHFYDNLLGLTEISVEPVPFYLLDHKLISDMPGGADIVVNAGPFGSLSFNMRDYEYHTSGLASIVEDIRNELYPTGPTPSPEDMNGYFTGFIRRKPGTPANSSNTDDYFIEWMLFVYDVYVDESKKEFIAPRTRKEGEKSGVFEPGQRFKQKVKGKGKKLLEKIKKRAKIAKTPGAPITTPKVDKKQEAEIKKLKAQNAKLEKQLKAQAAEMKDLKAMMATMIAQQSQLIAALTPKSPRKKK